LKLLQDFGGGMKGSSGGGEFKYDIFDILQEPL
jgi:CRISPR/Cas system CSM-associated protein Csm4 (group 5 of RAMP superfamily)